LSKKTFISEQASKKVEKETPKSIHKAGFVNIIGKPNVGKSTLMNAMIGEKLSIISSKAQTTRHRIMGMINGEDFQVIYSDTPGIMEPAYELHKAMMSFVESSLDDADIILFVTDMFDEPATEELIRKLKKIKAPIFLIINKVDLASQEKVAEKITFWKQTLGSEIEIKEIIPVSALKSFNITKIFDLILQYLPENPPYYSKEDFTDKPERFFAAEMVREQIFANYTKEIPYCCEVVVTGFKEEENIIKIRCEILVERKTQKGILIGKNGEMLKKVGTEARKNMEQFFNKKVFLEQHVKIEPDWRNKKILLERFGYSG
jgi:GTP-binding protein Era